MRTLGTYRGYDNLWHYVHIIEIPGGSDGMSFHCMKPQPIDWSQPMRDDMFANCLWCVCNASM